MNTHIAIRFWSVVFALALLTAVGVGLALGAGSKLSGDSGIAGQAQPTGLATASGDMADRDSDSHPGGSAASPLKMPSAADSPLVLTGSAVQVDVMPSNNSVTSIELEGQGIQIEGEGAVAEGSTVTITAEGSYRVSGTMDEGQVVVDAGDDDVVRLLLNGVSIHNSMGAAIAVLNAETVVVVLENGTQNFLSDGENYVFLDPDEDEPNAALFSKTDLVILGSGELTVDANFNDGIASKDGLIIASGILRVDAADDGIRGKDYLIVKDGHVFVTAAGDGLKSDEEDDEEKGYIEIENGTFRLTTGGDAMQAERRIAIADGEFDIVTAGGSSGQLEEDASAKAIKAGEVVEIGGGVFDIDAADDGIHANGMVIVYDGTFDIATGDDALHADAALTIHDGDITVTASYEGIESAIITINGGALDIESSDDGINVAGEKDDERMRMGPPPGGMAPPQWDTDGENTLGGPTSQLPAAEQSRPAPPADGRLPGAPFGGQLAGAGAPTDTDQFLYIHGGTILVNAGGDGIDVNGAIEMTGGYVLVYGPTSSGNSAIDYDAYFDISSGVVVAAGSAGMAQAASATSAQPSVLVNFDSMLPAGTLIHLQDSAGNTLFTLTPFKDFQSVLFSSPALEVGESYEVYFGGTSTGVMTDGLALEGEYAPGSLFDTFTVAGAVTTVGTTMMRGGPRRP